MKHGSWIFPVVIVLASSGCVRKSSTSPREGSSASANRTARVQKRDVARSPGLNLLDPNNAKVTVSLTEVTAGEFGKDFKVPSFGISYSGTDHAQILRCQDWAHDRIDKAVAEVAGKESADDRRWAWFDTFGNQKLCKVVTMKATAIDFVDSGVSEGRFLDIAAPNGKFFYLVNPCVSKELSTTGKEECSYYLALTNSIEFDGSLKNTFIAYADALNRAESEYDALVLRFATIVQQIEDQKEGCLVDYAAELKKYQDEAKSKADNFAEGNLNTLFYSLGTGLLAGGIAGLMGLRSRQALAKSSTKTVGPPAKGFTFGEHPFLTGGGVAIAAAGFATAVRKHFGEFESWGARPDLVCPQVQSLAKELQDLTSQKLIETAMQKIICLAKEMNKLDQRFTSYDAKVFKIPQELETKADCTKILADQVDPVAPSIEPTSEPGSETTTE